MRSDTVGPGTEKPISDRDLNILFTCVGRRVMLLEAFRRAMTKLGVTGKLIAADRTSAASAFHTADVGETVPLVGRVEYVPALLDLVKRHHVGLVVPLTDLDLRSLARQAGKFANLGCTIMVGSEPDIKLCRDKARSNELFGEAGLEKTRTCTLREFRTEPFYPCFVKPVRGSASIGTGIIRNEHELKAHVATFGELLVVQECLGGQEFTIDVYRDRQGQVRCVVPRQRLTVRGGEVAKAITVKDDELIDAAIKLSGLLGDLWGVFCCQCRRSPGGRARFFEINPRFGGGAPLSIAAGADLPSYLLQEVLGLPITAEVGNFTENLLMLRYDGIVFAQADDKESLPGFRIPELV